MPHLCISARRTVAALSLLAAAFAAGPARAQSAADAAADAIASQLKSSSSPGLSGLQLYGFSDFTYAKYFFTKTSGLQPYFGKDGTFAVGDMNLYLDAQLSARARSLLEVRFTYMPSGSWDWNAGTGTLTYNGNGQPDYTDYYRTKNLGAISVERAWIEYRLDDLLTLRGGQFLTPYGIWNVDHGSPAIVPVLRPLIIGQQLFPESQSGLEAYGSTRIRSALVGYHLTFSNGRMGSHGAFQALNGRPGVGGRIFVEPSGLGELRVGVSAYRGRYTDQAYKFSASGVTEIYKQRYDELALGADLHWSYQGLLLNAEYLSNAVYYKDGKPTHADMVTPITHDRRWGTYVMVGYALPFAKKVMPFVMQEYYRKSNQMHHEGWVNDEYQYTFGVNYHLQPNLVLKAQYAMTEYKGKNLYHFSDGSSNVFAQAAWSF